VADVTRLAKRWLPWVLLAGAVVVAVTVIERPSRVPEPAGGPGAFRPAPGPAPRGGSPSPAAGSAPSSASSGSASALPPMSLQEQRDFRIHIPHEQCEDGVQRINVLEGKPPTDPSALTFLSVCLRIGNLAWYKCIVGAETRPEAAVCNRRFLSLDHPSP
jgi:hypothetical protein